MTEFDGWEQIELLGKGGQGTVWKACSPAGVAARQREISTARQQWTRIPGSSGQSALAIFAKAVHRLGAEDPSTLGALKIFELGSDSRGKGAIARLEKEAEALGRLKGRPGVLKLLHANVEKRFIVTEYFPKGALSAHPRLFEGSALRALKAFRPLVCAVRDIHSESMVHRDIKPENIFLGDNDGLTLGDFGIVFIAAEQERRTGTLENVGSRDWQPGWAMGSRLQEVTAPFDLFCLGKVLWSMASGRQRLRLWYFKSADNDLERLFPSDLGMAAINAILARCVVEHEKDCIDSAGALLDLVEAAISSLSGKPPLVDGGARPCRVCGLGSYQPQTLPNNHTHKDRLLPIPGMDERDLNRPAVGYFEPWQTAVPVRVYSCDACGHTEFFQYTTPTPGRTPMPAWRGRQQDRKPPGTLVAASKSEGPGSTRASPNDIARAELDAIEKAEAIAAGVEARGLSLQAVMVARMAALLLDGKERDVLHASSTLESKSPPGPVFALTSDELYRRKSSVPVIEYSLWSSEQKENLGGWVQIDIPKDAAGDILVRQRSREGPPETLVVSVGQDLAGREEAVGTDAALRVWESLSSQLIERVKARRLAALG